MCRKMDSSAHCTVTKLHTLSFTVYLNGRPISAIQSPENKHFKDVNVLGMHFMNAFRCKLVVDFPVRSAKVEMRSLGELYN